MADGRRRNLNQDELDVHEVLSPTLGSQRTASVTSLGQPPRSHRGTDASMAGTPLRRPLHSPNVLNLGDLAALIRTTVVTGMKDGFALSSPSGTKRKLPEPVARPSVDQDADNDLPSVGNDHVDEDTGYPDGVFGYDVNADPNEDSSVHEGETEPDHSFVPARNPLQPSVSAPVAPSGTSPVEPDEDLPSVSPRLPATWTPKDKIIKWLGGASTKEWTMDDRKKIIDSFHPTEQVESLLLPAKMPSKLYKAIKAPAAKRRDYLLNRQDIEKNLYNASSDLCAGLRPLVEAISLLDDRVDCKNIKFLIGQGIMGALSANLKISRSRREVGRRFVRLDCAEALYSVAPTPNSLFGSSSVSEAVKQAKETTKLDDSLVYAPPVKKPFRSTHPGSKGFYRGARGGASSSKFQDSRQSYWDSQSKFLPTTSQYRGQSRRGRNRGGRRGSKFTRKASSKE